MSEKFVADVGRCHKFSRQVSAVVRQFGRGLWKHTHTHTQVRQVLAGVTKSFGRCRQVSQKVAEGVSAKYGRDSKYIVFPCCTAVQTRLGMGGWGGGYLLPMPVGVRSLAQKIRHLSD